MKTRHITALCKKWKLNKLSPVNVRHIGTCYKNVSRFEPGVYLSTSKNIFQNLAVEDWIYENIDMQNKAILLIWQNTPAVVIGRHQNTWAEANINAAKSLDIPIVRRKSGGGTVYHDLGNVNISFITHRKQYDRSANLELISSMLKEEWGLNVAVNNRDDLILNDKYKISGTAAKLGVKTAYHHLTLLLNADITNLYAVLRPDVEGICTKATSSVKSPVCNLQETIPALTFESLLTSLCRRFGEKVLNIPNMQLNHIDPSLEGQFPGISEVTNELRSWEWTYCKTPKFQVNRGFLEYVVSLNGFQDIDFCLEINKGLISSVKLVSKYLVFVEELNNFFNQQLIGVRYSLHEVTRALNDGKSLTNSQHKVENCDTILHNANIVEERGTGVGCPQARYKAEKAWVEGLLCKHLIGNS